MYVFYTTFGRIENLICPKNKWKSDDAQIDLIIDRP